MKKLLKYLTYFFTPRNSFSQEEWLLKYQIQSMLLFSFFFGIGVFIFSIFRYLEGNYIVAYSQLIFSILSIYVFFHLRQSKKLYHLYSIIFFIIFFFYTGIIFFFVPQNTLNILWVISAPILIFFFLNKRGGIAMFILVFGFICYLILFKYPYTIAEFITLISAFFITSFMMYMYEKVKEKEKLRLLLHTQVLQEEVDAQTKELQHLNERLEHKVEEEVNKRLHQEQMLLAQNRMANMGMMIDSIAHQWRQPLMNINAKLMNISRVTELCDKKDTNKDIEYIDGKVENIFTITEQMSQTIHDFRNLFKSEKELEEFELTQLIKNILTFMDEMLVNISIHIEVDKPIYLISYQNELSQVLLTILQNSIEALKEENIEDKEITIHIYELSSNVYIEIIDNAKGIKEEILQKIFEPYFSTKKRSSGTGLGLYIAKIIMDSSLHGEINVLNTKEGVKFTVIAPNLLKVS